jgi:hypothetical protein
MILKEGVHKFKCEAPSFDYASASAPSLTVVKISRNGKAEDLCYVVGATHTWWGNNPMFSPPLSVGDEIEIEIKGPGAMRLECGGLV